MMIFYAFRDIATLFKTWGQLAFTVPAGPGVSRVEPESDAAEGIKGRPRVSELQLQPTTSPDQLRSDDTTDLRVSAKLQNAFQSIVSRVVLYQNGPARNVAGAVQHHGQKGDKSVLPMLGPLSALDTQSPALLPPQVGANGCASVVTPVCMKTRFFLGAVIVQKENIKIQTHVSHGKRRYRNLGPLKEFCAALRDKAHENMSVAVKALSQALLRRHTLDGRLFEPVIFSDSSSDFKEALLLAEEPQISRNDIRMRNPRTARNFPIQASAKTRPAVDQIAQEDETPASIVQSLRRLFYLSFFD